jgi:dephospho-CoA kinase
LSDSPPLLLIIGPTAVGKTTAGQHLAERHHFLFFEASSAFRDLADGTDLDPTERARVADLWLARHGHGAVARRLLELLDATPRAPTVIAGLRTTMELVLMCSLPRPVTLVSLAAPERARLDRYMRKCRSGDELQVRDEIEHRWGALDVIGEVADRVIANGRTLEAFRSEINRLVEDPPQLARPAPSQRGLALQGLAAIGPHATAGAVADWAGLARGEASAGLSRSPHLASRTDINGESRYSLTLAGAAYAELLCALAQRRQDAVADSVGGATR